MIRAPLRLVRATPRPQAARNAAKDDDKARLSAVTLSLAKTRPEYSARRVFTVGQIFWLLLLATLLTGGFVVAPIPTASLVIVLTTLFYLASFLFKTFLFSTSPKRLVPAHKPESLLRRLIRHAEDLSEAQGLCRSGEEEVLDHLCRI
jgi:hypothetical protein